MTVQVIEITDPGIRVIRAGEIFLQSPGYAVIEPEHPKVGEAAFNQARIDPRKTHNQFWYRLSLDPLAQPAGRFRHTADLAYAHLNNIAAVLGDEREVIFAVPGSYSNEQLSLILGIARECSLNVVGLVDLAVAAAVDYPPERVNCHLDIQLHQLVVTKLTYDDYIRRESVVVESDVGLVALYEAWVQLVADTFLEQSRFDPLHDAKTEQALYSRLPEWLGVLQDSQEVELEVMAGGSRFQARLLKSRVIEKAFRLYQIMAEKVAAIDGLSHVLVSDRVAELPGFCDMLPDYRVVSDLACYQGCESNRSFICQDSDSLSFVTSLPLPERYRNWADQPSENKDPDLPATHLLAGHWIYGLAEGLYLGSGETKKTLAISTDPSKIVESCCRIKSEAGRMMLENLSQAPVSVNGEPVNTRLFLKPGDRLVVTDCEPALLVVSEV